MKICAVLVMCLVVHAGISYASCDDDVTSLEAFMRHTNHVADLLDLPEGVHLVARADAAPSWRAYTLNIMPSGFSDVMFKYPSLAALEKSLAGEANEHADPDWQKTKPGLAGHYDDILLVVDASTKWSDVVSAAQLAVKSGFKRVSFVFERERPVPPAHTSVDDLMANAHTTNERSKALIKLREGFEQECPGFATALTHAKLQHDTYENTVVPGLRSWLTACHCSVHMPELRSWLFYFFAPQLETGLVTVELDKHAPVVALPAHTLWHDAAAKIAAGRVWLVAT